MSTEGRLKRKCIVQKLDFENCIITNIKTTAKRRKKLRARITRGEVEDFPDVSHEKQSVKKALNSPLSPLSLTHRTSQAPEPASPVLMKKQSRKARSQEVDQLSEEPAIEGTPSPGSPVFKAIKKHRVQSFSIDSLQEVGNVSEGTASQRGSSGLQNSFHIEDFTQGSSQSVDISSVNSTDLKNKNSGNSFNESIASVLSCQHNLADSSSSPSNPERDENQKLGRRNYKKNSLLGKLHKLRQKQASEKLLWQHQNLKSSSGSLRLSVVRFWKEEFNYFLNCQSSLPGFEKTLLIVDSRWVPNLKRVKEGSVLDLHPPWQKLLVEESAMPVLLNVICLEVLDETEEPILPKQTFESVPLDRFETDQKMFIDSLFSQHTSGCLY